MPSAAKTVEEVKEMLQRSDKGTIWRNIRNVTIILENDPQLAGIVSRNELTGLIDIVRDVWWSRDSTSMTDQDMNYILMYLEETYGFTNEKKISKAIEIVANEHRYHPIRVILESLVWDGTSRIRRVMHHFFGADESDMTYACVKLFLMGAINRVYHKGCKFDYMLCLVGSQGLGKSTFARYLALGDEYYSDDIRDLNDENIYRKLQGHWILEMGEMVATMNAKSCEEIKSFLSRQKETYKVPYEVHPADRPRQCVFLGTTNKRKFLPFDRSGNRRFLPIDCNADAAEVRIYDDEEASKEYIQQLWAEAMVIYRNGDYSMKLDKAIEKKLVEYQKEFMPEDTKAGIIQVFLDHYKEPFVCSRLIWEKAFHNEFREPKEYELRDINDIMNSGSIDGWIKVKQHRYDDYGTQWSWGRKGDLPKDDADPKKDQDQPQEKKPEPKPVTRQMNLMDDFVLLGEDDKTPFDDDS